MTACCVCIGTYSVEIKTEADSNDIIECPPDVKPTIGILGYSYIIFSTLICHICFVFLFLLSMCFVFGENDQYFVHNFHKFKSRISVILVSSSVIIQGGPKN